jgi:chemotaxis protein histidine kinase CheA
VQVQGEPPEAIPHIPIPKNPSKNNPLAPKMAEENFSQLEAQDHPIPIPHAEATKQANLVQETRVEIYRKAKTNKVNKTFVKVASLREICHKMNQVIQYLESSASHTTRSTEPDNIKAISDI